MTSNDGTTSVTLAAGEKPKNGETPALETSAVVCVTKKGAEASKLYSVLGLIGVSGKATTVMALGDSYDTGKNSAVTTTESVGPEATDSGADALVVKTTERHKENLDAKTTVSLVSSIIITLVSKEIAEVPNVVDPRGNTKATAGGVLTIEVPVEETGVDGHLDDVVSVVLSVKKPVVRLDRPRGHRHNTKTPRGDRLAERLPCAPRDPPGARHNGKKGMSRKTPHPTRGPGAQDTSIL